MFSSPLPFPPHSNHPRSPLAPVSEHSVPFLPKSAFPLAETLTGSGHPCDRAQKLYPASRFPATLAVRPQLTENTTTLSPAFATLTTRVNLNPFVCHSYKKHRGGVAAPSLPKLRTTPSPFTLFPQRVNIQRTATVTTPLGSCSYFTVPCTRYIFSSASPRRPASLGSPSSSSILSTRRAEHKKMNL